MSSFLVRDIPEEILAAFSRSCFESRERTVRDYVYERAEEQLWKEGLLFALPADVLDLKKSRIHGLISKSGYKFSDLQRLYEIGLISYPLTSSRCMQASDIADVQAILFQAAETLDLDATQKGALLELARKTTRPQAPAFDEDLKSDHRALHPLHLGAATAKELLHAIRENHEDGDVTVRLYHQLTRFFVRTIRSLHLKEQHALQSI